MARTKEFNPEEALDVAVDVFWRLGYEHTSLDALMQAMGVARQSLYDTFGDKRALYLNALTRYRDGNHAMLRELFSGRSVKDGFAKLLFDLARESRAEHERGCLLLSANIERSADDIETAEFLRNNQKTVERIFLDAFIRAQERGEISGDKDVKALARFFVATIQGMRATARVSHEPKALETIAEVALKSLE
jgi:TetR/AcrR family transcriptional repressor of nem operon